MSVCVWRRGLRYRCSVITNCCLDTVVDDTTSLLLCEDMRLQTIMTLMNNCIVTQKNDKNTKL